MLRHDRPVVGPRAPASRRRRRRGRRRGRPQCCLPPRSRRGRTGAPPGARGRARDRIDRALCRRLPAPVLEPGQRRAVARQHPAHHRVQRDPRPAGRRRPGRLPVPAPRRGVVVGVPGLGRDAARARRRRSSCSMRRRPASWSRGSRTDGIVGATFCARDGIADPSGLSLGFATAARRAGAEIRTRVEVTRIDVDGAAVAGVETAWRADRLRGRDRRRRAVGRPSWPRPPGSSCRSSPSRGSSS